MTGALTGAFAMGWPEYDDTVLPWRFSVRALQEQNNYADTPVEPPEPTGNYENPGHGVRGESSN